MKFKSFSELNKLKLKKNKDEISSTKEIKESKYLMSIFLKEELQEKFCVLHFS